MGFDSILATENTRVKTIYGKIRCSHSKLMRISGYLTAAAAVLVGDLG